MGGNGDSSVAFQVEGLKFFVAPDDEDAPARLARLADPTTAASRNSAGSPSSFRLPRRGGCVVVVSVTAAQPLSRLQPRSGVMSAATGLGRYGTFGSQPFAQCFKPENA